MNLKPVAIAERWHLGHVWLNFSDIRLMEKLGKLSIKLTQPTVELGPAARLPTTTQQAFSQK